MMRWIQAVGSLMILGTLSGCGTSEQSPTEMKEVYDASVMSDVAEMYRTYIFEYKKPPANAKALDKYRALNGNGLQHIVKDEIIVLWGTPLADTPEATGAVLAYEKKAPEEGGVVLMQDGNTIRKLTADEFKAAPKASKS